MTTGLDIMPIQSTSSFILSISSLCHDHFCLSKSLFEGFLWMLMQKLFVVTNHGWLNFKFYFFRTKMMRISMTILKASILTQSWHARQNCHQILIKLSKQVLQDRQVRTPLVMLQTTWWRRRPMTFERNENWLKLKNHFTIVDQILWLRWQQFDKTSNAETFLWSIERFAKKLWTF